jgi:hypothetical protein
MMITDTWTWSTTERTYERHVPRGRLYVRAAERGGWDWSAIEHRAAGASTRVAGGNRFDHPSAQQAAETAWAHHDGTVPE